MARSLSPNVNIFCLNYKNVSASGGLCLLGETP